MGNRHNFLIEQICRVCVSEIRLKCTDLELNTFWIKNYNLKIFQLEQLLSSLNRAFKFISDKCSDVSFDQFIISERREINLAEHVPLLKITFNLKAIIWSSFQIISFVSFVWSNNPLATSQTHILAFPNYLPREKTSRKLQRSETQDFRVGELLIFWCHKNGSI